MKFAPWVETPAEVGRRGLIDIKNVAYLATISSGFEYLRWFCLKTTSSEPARIEHLCRRRRRRVGLGSAGSGQRSKDPPHHPGDMMTPWIDIANARGQRPLPLMYDVWDCVLCVVFQILKRHCFAESGRWRLNKPYLRRAGQEDYSRSPRIWRNEGLRVGVLRRRPGLPGLRREGLAYQFARYAPKEDRLLPPE